MHFSLASGVENKASSIELRALSSLDNSTIVAEYGNHAAETLRTFQRPLYCSSV
jgi:hypothetical protein